MNEISLHNARLYRALGMQKMAKKKYEMIREIFRLERTKTYRMLAEKT